MHCNTETILGYLGLSFTVCTQVCMDDFWAPDLVDAEVSSRSTSQAQINEYLWASCAQKTQFMCTSEHIKTGCAHWSKPITFVFYN